MITRSSPTEQHDTPNPKRSFHSEGPPSVTHFVSLVSRQTGKIEPVVLPLLWFEQSGAMGGKPLNTFYTQLVLMPQILQYAQYVLLGLGGLLLLVPVIYQLRSQVSWRGGQARVSAPVAAGICLLQLAVIFSTFSHPALTFLYMSWKAQDPPGWVLG